MKYNNLLSISFIMAMLFAPPAAAQEQPVVYSQTIIAIVPGTTVPKAVTQSPALQAPLEDASDKPASASEDDTAESDSTFSDLMTEATAADRQLKLRVQVRNNQIALDNGLFTRYRLDEAHGVLTYYSQARQRDLIAENIHQPLDVLFIRDDGIIAQIVPEIVLAYLPEDITVDFPIRALLFMRGGLSAEWGVQPGYRIEHGMFKPKPLIYKVDK